MISATASGLSEFFSGNHGFSHLRAQKANSQKQFFRQLFLILSWRKKIDGHEITRLINLFPGLFELRFD